MIQGEVVLMTFPFTDLTSLKVRPALVISKEQFNKRSADAIFIMITSSTKNIRQEDVILKQNNSEFSITGLKKDSVIRTSKIYCLSQSLAKRELGKTGPKTLNNIFQKLNDLFLSAGK